MRLYVHICDWKYLHTTSRTGITAREVERQNAQVMLIYVYTNRYTSHAYIYIYKNICKHVYSNVALRTANTLYITHSHIDTLHCSTTLRTAIYTYIDIYMYIYTHTLYIFENLSAAGDSTSLSLIQSHWP